MANNNHYREQEAMPFYSSMAWVNCRRAYAKSRSHLCERCLARGIIKRGEIVHHIIPLNSKNISDPAVSLSFDNLMLLCRQCHGAMHTGKRYTVDEFGRVQAIDTLP